MPEILLSHNQPFFLDQTLGCGQVFRWERSEDGWWYGIVGNRVIKVRQDGEVISFEGASKAFIISYFSLDTNLVSILESIDRDPVIHTAIRHCLGLRLVRQPKWECLISYICSTNSSIPVIRRRIAAIARQFGEELRFEDTIYHAFPDPAKISCEGMDALSACKLGYRKPYVFNAACQIGNVQQWEERITDLPYEDARSELLKLSGVGPKAADCILLFAFQKYEAFPVDIWIRRIMQQHYIKTLDLESGLTNRDYNMIRRFAHCHFGEYCGYAQEYLYAVRNAQKGRNR